MENNSLNKNLLSDLKAKVSLLFKEGIVSSFLGFTTASLPMAIRPFHVKNEKDIDKLIWNSFCYINLANYLPELTKNNKEKKTGVIVTGCWSRNIVVQIQEGQLKREDLYILGISSRGMINPKNILDRFPEKEILNIKESDHNLTVEGRGFSEQIKRWDVTRDNCKTCNNPDPVIYDDLVGNLAGKRNINNKYYQVDEIEDMPHEKRWEWFLKEIDKCIRCYACRNSCPLCYCPTCFVDDSRPQWLGKSVKQTETAIFHILRAYHCAGRCTDCGTCESVCPMGIKMRLFTRKLEKDVFNLFGVEAGLDINVPLPLTTYKMEDPEDFIFKTEEE